MQTVNDRIDGVGTQFAARIFGEHHRRPRLVYGVSPHRQALINQTAREQVVNPKFLDNVGDDQTARTVGAARNNGDLVQNDSGPCFV